MTKVTVKGHRTSVTPDEASQVLTVLVRTFDYNQAHYPGINKVSRAEFAKKVIDIVDTLGENRDQYLDLFPADWDAFFKD